MSSTELFDAASISITSSEVAAAIERHESHSPHGRDRRAVDAVQRRGEDLRHRRLARAARADEQVRVVDPVAARSRCAACAPRGPGRRRRRTCGGGGGGRARRRPSRDPESRGRPDSRDVRARRRQRHQHREREQAGARDLEQLLGVDHPRRDAARRPAPTRASRTAGRPPSRRRRRSARRPRAAGGAAARRRSRPRSRPPASRAGRSPASRCRRVGSTRSWICASSSSDRKSCCSPNTSAAALPTRPRPPDRKTAIERTPPSASTSAERYVGTLPSASSPSPPACGRRTRSRAPPPSPRDDRQPRRVTTWGGLMSERLQTFHEKPMRGPCTSRRERSPSASTGCKLRSGDPRRLPVTA